MRWIDSRERAYTSSCEAVLSAETMSERAVKGLALRVRHGERKRA